MAAPAFFIQSKFNNLVLDVQGGSAQAGTKVILWPMKQGGDNLNQLWRFTHDGFVESVLAPGLVLDIEGGASAGAKLILWHKKGHDAGNQQWRHDPSTESIICPQYNLALDVEGGSTAHGTHAIAWHKKSHHENFNQRWAIVPAGGPSPYPAQPYHPAQPYPAQPAYPQPAYPQPYQPAYPAPGYPAQPVYPVQPAYPPQPYPAQPAYPQPYQPAPVHVHPGSPHHGHGHGHGFGHGHGHGHGHEQDGSFYIRSSHSDLVLDIKGGHLRPGTPVIMWPQKHKDSKNQLWRLTHDGYIENPSSGLVLDIEGGAKPGAKLIVYTKKPHHEAANQRWRYDASTQLFYSYEGGLVLDVEGGSKAHGTHVVAWHPKGGHDNHNQRFHFVRP